MRPTEIIVFVSAVVISLLIGLSSLLPAEIYSSAIWHILWIAIAVALIFGLIIIVRKTRNAKRATSMGRLRHNGPALIMHIAFLFMIAGGFCTSLFSRRGTLHLFPSQTSDCFISPGGKVEKLPSAVTLLSFAPEYYPGMNFPKDFKTKLKTDSGDTIHISMNHIGRLGNYRLYQTSYDDQGGTVLTVTYDPAGIAVTYTGFFLFALGGLAWLLKLAGRARKSIKKSALLILLCFICFCSGNADAVPEIDTIMTDSLATHQVLFNGETVSFAAFADRLTYKLTGRGSVGGLSPEAFVASLIKYQEEWSKVPFLKIKSKGLREALAVDGKYASVDDLYDDQGGYILSDLYEGGAGPIDKDILALDEKIALLIDLWDGKLFTPLPADSGKLRSNFSIKAEIFYYKINPVRVLFICSILTVAFILLMQILKQNVRFFPIIALLGLAGILAFAWLWYISGSVPLSATPDIMEFVGICMILLTGIAAWHKESPLLLTLGMASATFLLLVAMLGMKDPVLSPVMPVLASPWLSVHVSLVMLSYAVLGFTLPVAITALLVSSQRDRLINLSMSLLAPGIFLLGLGIITGAMSANVSSGR